MLTREQASSKLSSSPPYSLTKGTSLSNFSSEKMLACVSIFKTIDPLVGVQSSQKKMTHVNSAFHWQSYNEELASSSEDDSITSEALWEQVNVTRDSTDYLWYIRVSTLMLMKDF